MEQILSTLHTAASFIAVLSVIVFIHEFGHYIVARLCGVRITTFSIGFGKEIFGWNDRHGTRWKVSVLPLGGYVKMFGDASAASNADIGELAKLSDEEKLSTFHFKPLHQKAAVVAAGPIFNFILTIFILTIMIFTYGLQSTEPVVGELIPGSPAEAAKLEPGDRVESVNGKKMKRFSDIPMAIAVNLETPVELVIIRNNEKINLTITPKKTEDMDALGNKISRPMIGIKSPVMTFENVTLPQALAESLKRTYQICESTLVAVGQIISGDRGTEDLKGPIGIAQLSGQAAEKDFSTLLWLIAMLSANLGLVNLFPIPLLDGGHLVFYSFEAIKGRPLAEKFHEWSYRAGYAIILSLMLLTLYNDLVNIVFG